MRWTTRSTAAALAGLSVIVGCFSERASGPAVDLAGCSASLPAEAFGSTLVVVRNFSFDPAVVRVRPGTRVTWVNCEPPGTAAHTSTADAGAWSSPLLEPGSTFTREFAAVGTFAYHCEPHPGMQATVAVE